MSCCCSNRLSVHDCFERGLATLRQPAFAVCGDRVTSASGFHATFSLEVDADAASYRFQCTSCTTLVAYCQALVELGACRSSIQAMRQLDSNELITQLPGVPPAKQDRAILAIAALRSAILAYESTHSR